VASQYHPEFKSRPERPAPLFREFVRAAQVRAGERRPEAAAPAEAGDTAGEIRASRIESPH
jgi:CTP synthase